MKLGLIGCGKMGRALLEGALRANIVQPENVYVSSRTSATRETLAKELKVNALDNNVDVVKKSDVIYLCAKPQILPLILIELAEEPELLNNVLLVSVVAGLSINTIESQLPHGTRLIRCMPNTPSLIGKGAAAYSLGTHATSTDAENVCKLLGAAGSVIETQENLMDAVTGVSGSGPAYVYTFIEALTDAGVLEGLARSQALELAVQTVLGAASMIAETGLHPAILRDMVTSPGGTTIAAVKSLEDNGFRSSTMTAVSVAAQKSRELGAQ